MNYKSKGKDNYIYLIFKFIWLIIVLPKALQLFVLLGVLFYYLLKVGFEISIPKYIKYFFAFSVVNSLAILFNTVLGGHSFSRIVAAINTNLVWYVALLFFCAIYSSNTRIDYNKIGKYCFYNLLILLCIFAFSYVLGLTSIKLFETREFWALDYINGLEAMRFCGLFEYSTLIGYFTVLNLPFAFYYLYNKKLVTTSVIFTLLCYIPIYKSNSRMSMVFAFFEILVCFYVVFVNSKISVNAKSIILILAVVACLLFLVFKNEVIYGYVEKLFAMREGSNSMRMYIYTQSTLIAWNKSPLIGIGIKEMIGDYPLGSHSTYIGVFYKTGILGSLFFIMGLFSMIKSQYKNARKSKHSFARFFFVSIIIFLFMLFTEDLDGVEWLAVLFFVIEALILKSNRVAVKEIIGDKEYEIVCCNAQSC